MDRTTVELTGGGTGLLSGEVVVTIEGADGSRRSATVGHLPPASDTDFALKLRQCGPRATELDAALNWPSAATLLRHA